MRFFKEYDGFLFEFNSLGEFLRFLVARFLGIIAGIAVVALIIYFLWLYG
jgi:hypothetical protein